MYKKDALLPQDEDDEPSKWYNVISTKADALQALEEMLDNIPKNNDEEPDLAFLFVSQFHGSAFTAVVQEASRRLPSNTRLLSAVGSGVIGQDCELEEASKPSMSLLLGHGLVVEEEDDRSVIVTLCAATGRISSSEAEALSLAAVLRALLRETAMFWEMLIYIYIHTHTQLVATS